MSIRIPPTARLLAVRSGLIEGIVERCRQLGDIDNQIDAVLQGENTVTKLAAGQQMAEQNDRIFDALFGEEAEEAARQDAEPNTQDACAPGQRSTVS